MSEITYQQYKENRQAEFNALPLFCAFGKDQFKEAMEKHGLTENDTDKIYSLGSGTYYLRTDADKIREFFNKPDPITELIKDPKFAEDAFYYEMGDHEYHINYYQGNWDVLSCFGNLEYRDDDSYEEYFKELGFEEQTKAAFRKARKRFLADADNYDWY